MQPLVYCTDIHYGAQPLCRKDNYNRAILAKLECCLKLAKQHSAVLLIGGDLFDKPNQNYYDLILLIDLFQRYKGVRVIVNRGNPSHDGFYENSPLTLLQQSNIVETSDNRNYVDIGEIRLIFAPNSDDPMSKDQHISKHHENYLMTHHLIVEKAAIYKHILIEDFITECDIVFCADYHPYQGLINSNGTIFVAPGSIARRKLTKDNLEKAPMCYLLTDTGIKGIEIPYDKDVWVEKSEKEKEKIEATELDMGNFTNEMKSGEDSLTLEAAWETFAQKNHIEGEVYEYISKRIFGAIK